MSNDYDIDTAVELALELDIFFRDSPLYTAMFKDVQIKREAIADDLLEGKTKQYVDMVKRGNASESLTNSYLTRLSEFTKPGTKDKSGFVSVPEFLRKERKRPPKTKNRDGR